MPYEVFIPDGCDYVEVKWLDEANATEIRSSGVDGLKLAAGQNISKVLVDISGIRNRLSTTDLFVETVEHSRLGPPHPRAALVGRTDQEEDLTFVATVGSNRGMSIRAFTSLQDAKDWLAT